MPRLIAVTATALVIIGAFVWWFGGDRTVRRDVIAPQPSTTPTPVDDGEVDEAFKCFFEARHRRDLEAGKLCMTKRYAASISDPVEFIGASSPTVERATIISSASQKGRVNFDTYVYWGGSAGLDFVSEDTVRVVREGDRWLVDAWERGEEKPVGQTTTVTLRFAAPGPPDCAVSDGTRPLVSVEREIPQRVVPSDLALEVVRELFTGPWKHEGVASSSFPPGSRVESFQVNDEPRVVLNSTAYAAATRNHGGCSLKALTETLDAIDGIGEVSVVEGAPMTSIEPDV